MAASSPLLSERQLRKKTPLFTHFLQKALKEPQIQLSRKARVCHRGPGSSHPRAYPTLPPQSLHDGPGELRRGMQDAAGAVKGTPQFPSPPRLGAEGGPVRQHHG